MGVWPMFSHKLLVNAIVRIKFRFASRLRLNPARAVIPRGPGILRAVGKVRNWLGKFGKDYGDRRKATGASSDEVRELIRPANLPDIQNSRVRMVETNVVYAVGMRVKAVIASDL